ncbi:polyketide synthase dehydratase domain-containing protein, partial [Planomonospora parontospora]|uniref:polyketide synthase dehydratase domain-containing protein n=1 Tax=Planomonospora parontospora TaxID=58119 RepID=UPI001942C1F6
DGAYEVLAGSGYGYGPVFQGLKAAWRRGDEVFAEVALPEAVRGEAGGFGVHPALLDSAMHALLVAGGGEREEAVLPFAWGGVVLHAGGASVARVRIAPAGGDAVGVVLADEAGRPVVSVGSLVSLPVALERLGGASVSVGDSLFRLEWVGVPAAAAGSSVAPVSWVRWDGLVEGARVPEAVVFECPVPETDMPETEMSGADVPGMVRSVTAEVLGVVQAWLAEERFASSRLVVVTRGAVAVGAEDVDVRLAPVWGLLRAV